MLELAFCGDDCNYCPRYIATINNDYNQLRDVALLWAKVGWKDTVVTPEEMVCHGCNQVNHCRYGIRECALDKNVSNCGACNNYPCNKVIEMFEQTEVIDRKCQDILSQEDYQRLQKAFFSKRVNLDRFSQED